MSIWGSRAGRVLATGLVGALALAACSDSTTRHPGAARGEGEGEASEAALYCDRDEVFRLGSCAATQRVPSGSLGRELAWLLAVLAGESRPDGAAAHFTPEYLREVMAAERIDGLLAGTTDEHGPLSLLGFAQPPGADTVVAVLDAREGRAAVTMRVAAAGIDFLEVGAAPPVAAPDPSVDHHVDVGGGRSVYLRCVGSGAPTVILEGGGVRDWARLQPELATRNRVCSWDRPNAPWGRSDPAPTPRTADAVTGDLAAALEGSGEGGPYLLVGGSRAGLVALDFAARQPSRIAGLVLLDANTPDYVTRRTAMLRRCLPPAQFADWRRAALVLPPRVWDAEQFDDATSQAQAARRIAADGFPRVPVLVLSHGVVDEGQYGADWPCVEEDERLWRRLQRDLTELSPLAVHRVVKGSGHEIAAERPEVVVNAVAEVLDRARGR